jgi:murein tripeptide amidase MpaA
LTVLLFLVCLNFSLADNSTPTTGIPVYENHSMMIIRNLPDDRLQEFLMGHFDIVEVTSAGEIRIVATEVDQKRLITEFGAEIEIENLEEYYRQGLDPTKDMGGYHTFDEIVAELEEVAIQYASITRLDIIGYSLENRPIYALKISDNPDIDEEDEPDVMYNALTHAREPMGMEIVLYFMGYILVRYGSVAEITEMIDDTEIWIVPVINVDGYVFNETISPGGGGMWRKNLRDNGDGTFGVDLNRNWGFYWGLDDFGSSPDGGSETYRGTAPFSEPEIQSMREFINAHNFVSIVNFHASGQVYLRPWSFNRGVVVPDFIPYFNMLDSLNRFNNYNIDQNFYSTNGGAPDWQYGEQFEKRKAFAYLPEVGTSFWPPQTEIFNVCTEHLDGNLFTIREAHRLWQRPTRSLATSFTHVLHIAYDCEEDYFTTPQFWNTSQTETYDIQIDFEDWIPDLTPGWANVPSFTGEVGPGDFFEVPIQLSPQNTDWTVDRQEYAGGLRIILFEQEADPVRDTLFFLVYMFIENTDTDVDGYVDGCDNCPLDHNPDQDDFDTDDVGDDCDNCLVESNPGQVDNDSDGYGNACDNCQDHYNPGQADWDEDGAGDLCDYVCGDVNTDNILDILDIVLLIDNKFKEGPLPYPEAAADVNNDEAFDILDIVFLIDNKFKEGPDPTCAI